jgi:hypothetical protein
MSLDTIRVFYISNESISRLNPTLTAKGNCFYNPTTREISNLLMDSEVFNWKDASGGEVRNTNYYAYVSDTIRIG